MTRYIHIRNWDRFQHYKKRGAPWIKDYLDQLNDDDYRDLSLADSGLLHRLRLLYARKHHRGIAVDTRRIGREIGQRVTRQQLDRLNHAGLIVFSASRTLDECLHDASPETEGETETEKYSPKEEGLLSRGRESDGSETGSDEDWVDPKLVLETIAGLGAELAGDNVIPLRPREPDVAAKFRKERRA